MLLFKPRFRTIKGKILFLSVMLAVSIALGGCQELLENSLVALGKEELALTSVSNIQNKKDGRTIYVRGTVINRSPFLGSAAYQLQDETDTVWVFTDNPLPDRGTSVFIKGKVRQESLPFKEKELGGFYLVELQQLTN